MEQLKDEEVGHDIDRRRRVAQPIEHAANAIFRPQGKGNVNPVDRARPGLIDQVGNSSQAATEVDGDVRAALRGPIVEKTDQLQAHLRRGLDVLGQLEAQLIDADDGEPSAV